MELIRKLVREELEIMYGNVEVPKECNLKNWLGILSYTQEKVNRNKKLEECIQLIKEATASGEPEDFQLSKISTILFSFEKTEKEPS